MIVQAELNNYCNGRCEGCCINDMVKLKEKHKNMTLQEFKELYPPEFLNKVSCFQPFGTYSEGTLNPHFLDIIKYLKKNNVPVSIETNGNSSDYNFWKSLGAVLNKKQDQIIFSINGAEKDTYNHYHKRLSLVKALHSAKGAIEGKKDKGGAIVKWKFIVFKHNIEELDKAKEMAKKMGFYSFITEYSRHFTHKKVKPIYNESNRLEKLVVEGRCKTRRIECKSEKYDYIYIDVYGNVFPCCFIYRNWKRGIDVSNVFKDKSGYFNMNLKVNDIDSIRTNIQDSTVLRDNPICRRKCWFWIDLRWSERRQEEKL